MLCIIAQVGSRTAQEFEAGSNDLTEGRANAEAKNQYCPVLSDLNSAIP